MVLNVEVFVSSSGLKRFKKFKFLHVCKVKLPSKSSCMSCENLNLFSNMKG